MNEAQTKEQAATRSPPCCELAKEYLISRAKVRRGFEISYSFSANCEAVLELIDS